VRTVTFVIVLVLLLGGATTAVAQDDLPDACRTIIGCPDAGPDPENPGDRGGYAQLLTLGGLAGAMGFIGWKITRAVRDGDRRQATPVSRPDPDRSP
jgi:hypothetical protein